MVSCVDILDFYWTVSPMKTESCLSVLGMPDTQNDMNE